MIPIDTSGKHVSVEKVKGTRKLRIWRRAKSGNRQQLKYQEDFKSTKHSPDHIQQHKESSSLKQYTSYFINRSKEPPKLAEEKTRSALRYLANEVISKRVNMTTEEGCRSLSSSSSMQLNTTTVTFELRASEDHDSHHQIGESANEARATRRRLKIRRRPKLRLTSDITLLLLLILSFSSLTIISLLPPSCLAAATAVTSKSNKLASTSNDSSKEELPSWQKQLIKDDTVSNSELIRSKRVAKFNSNLPSDQISSANLPAEFRSEDAGGIRKEQSRLARLCEQTSSVLASVLPAPFGGHKRSILCQFFGQVPEPELSTSASNQANSEQAYNLPLGPFESVAVLKQGKHPPVTSMLTPGRHPIQLVFEQQRYLAQQQQQQQNYVAALNSRDVEPLKGAASLIDYSYQQRLEPPQGMVQKIPERKEKLTQTGVGEQVKFNPTLAAAPFKPLGFQSSSSQLLSTSGWRIFDGARNFEALATSPEPIATKQQQITLTQSKAGDSQRNESSTKIDRAIEKASQITSQSSNLTQTAQKANQDESVPYLQPIERQALSNESRKETDSQHAQMPAGKGLQLLVMGKPPAAEQAIPNIAKRSQALKSTTRASWVSGNSQTARPSGERTSTNPQPPSTGEVRTIEVQASQQVINGTLEKDEKLVANSEVNKPARGGSALGLVKTEAHIPQESQQIQHKREELVIASINNLTRIAFGNQLRDTVKVINKLIDEQADMFTKHLAASTSSPISSSSFANFTAKDQLLGVESRASLKKVESPVRNSTSAKKLDLKKVGNSNKLSGNTSKLLIQVRNTTKLSTEQPTRITEINNGQFNQASGKATKKPKKRPTTGESLRISTQQQSHPYRSITEKFSTVEPTRKRTSQFTSTTPTIHPISLDIQRQDRTPWQLSYGPPTARTRSARLTSNQPARQVSSTSSKSPYPWLIPDQSAMNLDLLAASSLLSSKNQEQNVNFPDPFTRRFDNPEKARVVSGNKNKILLSNPLTSGKQALSLNRIEGKQLEQLTSTSKQPVDSLTTLKMSLTSQLIGASGNNEAQQSRWKPTTSHISHISASTSTSITTTTTTTTTTTKRPSTTQKPVSSTILTTTSSDASVDTKATDSISRYTSHWNDVNQLLATTRRTNNLLPQQSTPVQMAQTGEFFSAETIANWPERYQTMLEGIGSTASLPSETTRRNGEVYEARHKPSEMVGEGNQIPLVASAMTTTLTTLNSSYPNTQFTVLPANHKFTGKESEESSFPSSSSTQSLPLTTQSTQRPQYTISGPAVAYTLVGPFTNNDSTPSNDESALKEILLSSIAINDGTTTIPEGSGGTTNNLPKAADFQQHAPSSLRPPYISSSLFSIANPSDPQYQQQQQPKRNREELFENEESLGKPHITRKLYELLVPSTRNFVGAQNPLNQQRFNLSAMKFLAKSLLLPKVKQQQNTSESSFDIDPITILEELQKQNNERNTSNERYLEQLGTSLPYSYNNLLLNETGLVLQGSRVENSTNGYDKSIFSRASNLLNDLKQLEHKKAAALLAAIRYQVPGPLVRPWDLASDIYINKDESASLHERLDDLKLEDGSQHEYSLSNLFTALQSTKIADAVRKQRFVPRELLHARLSAFNDRYHEYSDNQPENSEFLSDRSDSVSSGVNSSITDFTKRREKALTESGYSFGTVDNAAGVFNGSRHDDADYLASQDQLPINQGNSGGNITRRWLNRLFHRNPVKAPAEVTNDYDLVDPKKKTHNVLKVLHNTGDSDEANYQPHDLKLPKHLHVTGMQPSVRESVLHDSIEHTRLERDKVITVEDAVWQKDKDQEVRMNNKSKLDELTKAGKKDHFDCSERQSGFYPDVETACQTFYHCSNTGHLLTFNCPQQTRFDEKSLKCGPWYEVPCDLERIKQRRIK